MKNLLFGLITILTLGLSLSVVAQRPNRGGTAEEMAKKQTEQMKTDLGLDESQTAKIGEINLKYAEKRKVLREQGSNDRSAMRESMRKMNVECRAELKKVLTEEQYQKYIKKEEEMSKERAGRRKS